MSSWQLSWLSSRIWLLQASRTIPALIPSSATAGCFATCGVNYTDLGTYTADMALEILQGGAVPTFHVMDGGIITVNKETAQKLSIDPSVFSSLAGQVVEVDTAA